MSVVQVIGGGQAFQKSHVSISYFSKYAVA